MQKSIYFVIDFERNKKRNLKTVFKMDFGVVVDIPLEIELITHLTHF